MSAQSVCQTANALPAQAAGQIWTEKNPFKAVVFPAESVDMAIKEISAVAQSEADAIFAENSQKNVPTNWTEFMVNFTTVSEKRQGKTEAKMSSFPSMPDMKERVVLAADRAKVRSESNCALNEQAESDGGDSGRSVSASLQKDKRTVRFPVPVDRKLIIPTPTEHELLPPKLWGKPKKHGTSSSDYEEPPPPVAPPVKRKRGRPRKNPLPDPNEYTPKHSTPKKRERVLSENVEYSREASREMLAMESEANASQGQDTEENLEQSEAEAAQEVQEEKITLPEPRKARDPEVVFPECQIDDVCGHRGSDFLVRMKEESYRMAKWLKREEISEIENGDETLKCFEHFGIRSQKPFYNPLFNEPERVLGERNGDEYFVKWTGLGYKYASWEKEVDSGLVDKFRKLVNPEEPVQVEEQESIKDIIADNFSLDNEQNDVVDELYQKYFSKEETHCTLYGNIGSILRLETGALIFAITKRHNLLGPFLLVVDTSILDLAMNEMAIYTELCVLEISADDEEEFQAIKNNAYVTEDGKPKFNIVVVASQVFQRFCDEFPKLKFALAVVDGSEIYDEVPSLTDIEADLAISIQKRDDPDLEIDSQDDSTFLHDELTLFCPMLTAQKNLYHSIIQENIDMLTESPDAIDKSRLYEVVTKLSAVSNFPSIMESHEFVIRKNSGAIKKKNFSDCGKMRVVTEMIQYAQRANQRLMVTCRDPSILDIMELYCGSHDILFVRGALSTKRMKLDVLSLEAKANKRIIVLSQFETHAVNWLSLMVDVIVVFDGVYNPMYYFSHAQRKPRKRDCLLIRLLSADTHESFLGACADHYDEAPMYEIFRAAAKNFMRPVKETAQKGLNYPLNSRFNLAFYEYGIDFQYLFDDEGVNIERKQPASPKMSRSNSKRSLEAPDQGANKAPKRKVEIKAEPVKVGRSESTKVPREYRKVIPEPKTPEKPPEPIEVKTEHHRPYHRKLIKRYRLPKGAAPPAKPPHGSIVIRRHKRMSAVKTEKPPPFRFIEFPNQVAIAESDKTFAWTPENLEGLFVAMCRYPWGHWSRLVPFSPQAVSVGAIKECCYRILNAVAGSSEGHPLIHRVCSEFTAVLPNSCFAAMSHFMSHLKFTTPLRIDKLEHMIRLSFLVTLASDPLTNLQVYQCENTLPAEEWTDADDRKLLMAVWEHGYSAFSLCNEWGLPIRSLVRRFEAELDESGTALEHAHSPETLPSHTIPAIDMSQDVKARLGKALKNYGLLSVSDLSVVTGLAGSDMLSYLERNLTRKSVISRIDFFDYLMHEIEHPERHYTEDLQVLEAISVHGIRQAGRSPIITSAMRTSSPTFSGIKKLVGEICANCIEPETRRWDSLGGLTPILPCRLADRQYLVKPGVIESTEAFSDEMYIYPIGYTAEIEYPSVFDKGKDDKYTCTIDRGENAPIFTVQTRDMVFKGETPERVWQAVARMASEVQGVDLPEAKRPPGHELFGLAVPLSLRIVQALPNADTCANYVPRAFKVPYFALQKRGVLPMQ